MGRLVEHQEPRHGPIVPRKPLVKSEVCDVMVPFVLWIVPFVLWIELVFEVLDLSTQLLHGRFKGTQRNLFSLFKLFQVLHDAALDVGSCRSRCLSEPRCDGAAPPHRSRAG